MISIVENGWHGVKTVMLLACIALFSGCATIPPVTVGEVIEMSKEGVPPETIIKKMRDSDSVYPLTAAQLAELHDMGVAAQVLHYMQQTYIDAVMQCGRPPVGNNSVVTPRCIRARP